MRGANGSATARLARNAAAGLVRLDPEALGKLVGFGLALIGHMAKRLGDIGLDRRVPQFSCGLAQKFDRLTDGIYQVFSHARPAKSTTSRGSCRTCLSQSLVPAELALEGASMRIIQARHPPAVVASASQRPKI